MRIVTDQTMTVWQSGAYVGSNRAMARVTIQPLTMMHLPVDNSAGTTSNGIDATTAFGVHNGLEEYSSAVFGQGERPVELPNVKSVSWSRNLNQDAATLTLVLYNTDPLPLGETPESAGDFDRIGYYTVDRGTLKTTNRWGYEVNSWTGRLAPDQTLRTYEGYGFDANLTPENDPHMYPSGVWLIDEVDFGSDGLITIQARDLVRVLIDQICFPPVVPLTQYPLDYMFHVTVPDPPTQQPTAGDNWTRLSYETDSGVPYYGANHTLYGHAPADAFDNNAGSYWLSIGNGAPNQGYSFEFVQGTVGTAKKVFGLQFQVWGGPYQCYVSVKNAGVWQGNQTIPYNPNNPVSAPNGANIPYVQSFTVGYEQNVKIALSYTSVTSIRLTFTDLYNSHIGPFVYRAGVRSVTVNTGNPLLALASQGSHVTGNYDDFSDIIKKLLAYGGFYWPSDGMAANALTDGTVVNNPSSPDDPILGKGRIWGDIELTGTHAATELTVDIWDKKPLMDGISYIRDIVAFVFFVDETGGAVWRSPNFWQIGNYIGDLAHNAGFTPGLANLLTIDESITLMDISVVLSSRDVREFVFVANSFGQYGATTTGWNPYPTGLQRVAGWTDQNFQSTDEAQRMSDLIMIRQMFQYRTDKIVIPGMPAFQIDDQVRVIERVTNEGYVHYINGIDSSFDMETGEWTYTLATQWLGTNPDGTWFVDFSSDGPLSQVTIDFLTAIHQVGGQ